MNFVFGYNDPVLQRNLLEVCLAREPSEAAVRAIDAALEADTLSWQHHRALPMICKSPALALFSAGSRTKILSIYKHTLSRNSLMIHALGRVQAGLAGAGFGPIIAMKGLSSIAYVTDGLGTRPMADLDLLVPGLELRPQESLKVLEQLGLGYKFNTFRSITLGSRQGIEFDLHWYVHEWAPGARLVEMISARSSPHEFLKYQVPVPCREHHLAHTLAHGILASDVTFHARWVVDFISALKTSPALDPGLFAEFADQTAVPGRMRQALEQLAEETPTAVALDRQMLLRLRDATRRSSRTMMWLFDQTPSVDMANPGAQARVDRLKKVIVNWCVIPAITCRRLRISYVDYLTRLKAYPPLPRKAVLTWLAGKWLSGGPKLAYRLILGR